MKKITPFEQVPAKPRPVSGFRRLGCLALAFLPLVFGGGCAGTALHITSVPAGASVYARNSLSSPIYLGATPLETKFYQGAPVNNLYVHQLGFVASSEVHIPLSGEMTQHFALESYAAAARTETSRLPQDFITHAREAIAALDQILQSGSSTLSEARMAGEKSCRQLAAAYPQHKGTAVFMAIEEAATILGLPMNRQVGPLAGEYLRADGLQAEEKNLAELSVILSTRP